MLLNLVKWWQHHMVMNMELIRMVALLVSTAETRTYNITAKLRFVAFFLTNCNKDDILVYCIEAVKFNFISIFISSFFSYHLICTYCQSNISYNIVLIILFYIWYGSCVQCVNKRLLVLKFCVFNFLSCRWSLPKLTQKKSLIFTHK